MLGGGGATVLSAFAGYGFARFRFRGSRILFYFVIAALLVPITAITLPLYLTYAKVHLINSIWGMVLPSMVTPGRRLPDAGLHRGVGAARAHRRRPASTARANCGSSSGSRCRSWCPG